MSDTERTLLLLKPDAVRRGLVGTILARYEAKGLTIEALELRRIDATWADRHYADHVEQPWYPPLRAYIPSVIEVVRLLNGATNAVVAAPGTIRGDLSLSNRENLVHASDSAESAATELALWFPDLG
jgi:nucleoside-diphosphate kinase